VVADGLGAMAPAPALARAGIDVQVHEQAQQLTEASADLSLAPNGLRMLKRLGVGDAARPMVHWLRLPGNSGDIGGMPVERGAGPVIAHRGARISVRSGFLDVPERDPGV
jgi:hypothetical protein